MKLPLWLKILIIMMLASIVFTVLGAVSEFVILPLIFIALMMFPGKTKDNPTFFKVIPYFWVLSWLAAVFLLVGTILGKEHLMGAESRQPTGVELWTTVLLTPPVLWLFLKRSANFIAVLIAVTVINLGIEGWVYYSGLRDLKAVFELTGSVLAECMMLVYFLKKYRPTKHRG